MDNHRGRRRARRPGRRGWHPWGVDPLAALVVPLWHAFDRGNPGGGGGGPMGRGCLFGRWGLPDDETARNRPPAPGAAALGLLMVAVVVLLWWFTAR